MNVGDRFEFFDREDDEINPTEKKCDFTDCKNYRDGKIDEICAGCDSRLKDVESTETTQKNKIEDTEKLALDITEELLGKQLNAEEKTVIKDCLKNLEKLFNTVETSEKTDLKKKTK